jgi:hypothetical protein
LGCGKKEGSPLVPVSGRVTLDKQPLKGALVRFQPEKREGDASITPDSYGTTDDQGNYTLKASIGTTEKEGAAVGKHLIQISIIERGAAAGKTGIKELVPAKYNRESKLTYTVPPEGTKEANFDLQSK